MSLLIVGSVALDTIQTPLGRVRDALGGSATYASLAARFLTTPRLVAVVGSDFPTRYLRLLERKGIDVAGLARTPGRTFRWQGRYGYDLNVAETLGVQLNVFRHFTPRLPGGWSATPCAFLGNIDPDLQLTVRHQLRRPRLVACDSMNFWIAGKRRSLLRLLRLVDLLCLNDAEARQLTGESHLGRVAGALLRYGPSLVAIKRGEHGVLLASGGALFSLPGYVVDDVRDPTGAGDSFAGGMLGYLAGHRPWRWGMLKQACAYGSAVASLTIEDFGTARLAQVTRAAVERRVAALRRLTHWL